MTRRYEADASITEQQYNDIWAIIPKAAAVVDEYEWMEDCVEAVADELGIEVEWKLMGRITSAIDLYRKGSDLVDECIQYGFTVR